MMETLIKAMRWSFLRLKREEQRVFASVWMSRPKSKSSSTMERGKWDEIDAAFRSVAKHSAQYENSPHWAELDASP